jgi:hypothetical protein
MYLSDKKRVELCLIPYMLWVISSSAQAETKSENKDLLEILDNLKYCCFEPLEGCANKEKLKKRIKRMSDEVLVKNYKAKPLYLVLLTIILWIKQSLDQDVFVLVEGSQFDLALQKIIESLEQHPTLFDKFYDQAMEEIHDFTIHYTKALCIS